MLIIFRPRFAHKLKQKGIAHSRVLCTSGFGAGGGVKMIAGQFGSEPIDAKGVERVNPRLVMRGGGPAFAFAFDHE